MVRAAELQVDAAPHQRGREVAFAVAGEHHEREGAAAHAAVAHRHLHAVRGEHLGRAVRQAVRDAFQLGDGELPFLQYVQEVVGQVDVALVQLVDEQDARLVGGQQGGAEGPEPDVTADPVDGARRPGPGAVVRLRGDLHVLQARDGVVVVEAVLEFGAADDGPAQYVAQAQFVGHRVGQGALAGAGAPGDEERPAQVQRRVDHLEVRGARPVQFGQVPVGAEPAVLRPVAGPRRVPAGEVPPRRRGGEPVQAVVGFAGAPVDEPLAGFGHDPILVVTRPGARSSWGRPSRYRS